MKDMAVEILAEIRREHMHMLSDDELFISKKTLSGVLFGSKENNDQKTGKSDDIRQKLLLIEQIFAGGTKKQQKDVPKEESLSHLVDENSSVLGHP